MPGLIPFGAQHAAPLWVLVLLIVVALFGGMAVSLWLGFWRGWTRFWHAVAIRVYLHRPWRVARDRARRRVV
jgi:hypothetical protein